MTSCETLSKRACFVRERIRPSTTTNRGIEFSGYRRNYVGRYLDNCVQAVCAEGGCERIHDVQISLELILAYDGRRSLESVQSPPLVFGGSEDPYFTPAVQQVPASGVRYVSATCIAGEKHGAFHERKCEFDTEVLEFVSSIELGLAILKKCTDRFGSVIVDEKFFSSSTFSAKVGQRPLRLMLIEQIYECFERVGTFSRNSPCKLIGILFRRFR